MDDHEFSAALRRTMEDLPRTFARPVPIDDLLAGVTAAAIDLIEGADCADVLVIWESEDFRSLAATRQLAIDVDGGGHAMIPLAIHEDREQMAVQFHPWRHLRDESAPPDPDLW